MTEPDWPDLDHKIGRCIDRITQYRWAASVCAPGGEEPNPIWHKKNLSFVLDYENDCRALMRTLPRPELEALLMHDRPDMRRLAAEVVCEPQVREPARKPRKRTR